MTHSIDSNNRSALAYSLNTADKISDVCQPFLANYGLNFTYARFFFNGKALYISCHKKWFEYYIFNNLHNNNKHHEHYLPPEGVTCALWSGFEKDQVFSALYDLDIWNGFTIYERGENYVDYFDFSTTRENTQIIDFYLNETVLLKKFIRDFKRRSSTFIDYSDSKKLIEMDKNISLDKGDYASYVDARKIDDFMTKIKRDFSSTH